MGSCDACVDVMLVLDSNARESQRQCCQQIKSQVVAKVVKIAANDPKVAQFLEKPNLFHKSPKQGVIGRIYIIY